MKQTTVIDPDQSWALEISELKSSGELLYFFTWRNFVIRYKQTFLGAAWAIFKPLILMVVFSVVFNRITDVGYDDANVPYPVFSYAGLLYWTYFSQTVTQVSSSLVSYQGIMKKIYFPRLLVPISTALTGLIDFGLSLFIYVAIIIYYGVSVGLLGAIVFIPLVFLSFITVLGIGIATAALNIRYRDVQQLIPFVVQILLFLTPVIYPVNVVPEPYQWVLFLNPMAGVIETSRFTLLGIGEFEIINLLISVVSALVILLFGLMFFKSQERSIGDLI